MSVSDIKPVSESISTDTGKKSLASMWNSPVYNEGHRGVPPGGPLAATANRAPSIHLGLRQVQPREEGDHTAVRRPSVRGRVRVGHAARALTAQRRATARLYLVSFHWTTKPMNLREFLEQRERELLLEIGKLQKALAPKEAELAEVRRAKAALGMTSMASEVAGDLAADEALLRSVSIGRVDELKRTLEEARADAQVAMAKPAE